MSIGEVLYATIGKALVRALVKSWLGDSDLLGDTMSSVADLLAEAGFSRRDARRVARELDEVTEAMGDRLRPFFEVERYGGLPDNEREAAAIAVAETIERGYSSPDVAFASDLDATRLEALLRAASPSAADGADLDPLAVRLYDVALTESCAYLVQVTEDLPRFPTQAFAEILARERRIIALLTKALDNLPGTDEDRALDFETRYMRQVASRLDRLELMGFGVGATFRYALSVAYISLTASPARSWRVDRFVSDVPRLLVTGDAGSGKTTLLQWLAVNAAKRRFTGRLKALDGSVLFFVQLRRYADDPLRCPAQFVDQTADVVAELMPERWERRGARRESADIAPEALKAIEAGEESPVLAQAQRIAAALGMTLTRLLGSDGGA